MPPNLSLEQAAVASFANLAAVDQSRALAMLDEVGTQAQDFADQKLAAVWAVVESIVRDGRQPDFYAVQAKCPTVPRQLLTTVLISDELAPPKERLLAVRTGGQRRRIGAALEAVRTLALDPSRPLPEAVSEAQRALEAIHLPESQSVTLDDELLRLCDQLDEVARGQREPVMATGIEGLDAVIGGLQRTLTIIGALPGVGKSALIAAMVRNLAGAGRRVGVFSLEDERGWITKRLVAADAKVPLFVLQNRPLGSQQKDRVWSSIEKLHARMRNVVVDDRPGLTTADVITSARNMIQRHRVEALLVDHLGEIRLTRSDRHDLDIADVLQQLRALAKTYKVPVVVACHLRRREGLTAKDDPRLTDFAFSAAVERMARVGLALSKPKDDTLRVHILKQTNGMAGGSVDLGFEGAAGVVANEAPDQEQLRRAQQMYGGADDNG